MAACPTCGTDVPQGARFCPSCGASLAAPRETRKTVTVLFCDWVGSTSLGEALDPESLRHVQETFFAQTRAVLARHGGLVEKFIGDAVMAVFGIPQAHEDDALRALRAAVELREALTKLNEELERAYGIHLSVRTGVNTGEVIAGDASAQQAFVTGDAVVVAKRLEEVAAAGEILIGDSTRLLARNAALVEPVEGLELKGKTLPAVAWRLLSVVTGVPAFSRRFDAPLVDRELELAVLQRAYERTSNGRTGHLVTMLGPAGVGKSRLVNELSVHVGDEATVLRGRCIPYGEGITFLPLVDILRQAAEIDRDVPADVATQRIAELVAGDPDAPVIAERLAAAVGLSDSATSADETFLAVRRLLGALAKNGPIVLTFDDIHWAEERFLDLIEYLVDWTRDMPVLLVCLARPDLLDERPTWGGGKVNATTILLEPLPEAAAESLAQNLLAGALADDAKKAIAAAAEGNPLFIEETLAMLVEEGALRPEHGEWRLDEAARVRVPPTIQALLAARLDRLPAEERLVLEAGAVIGKAFRQSDVAALTGDTLVEDRLRALGRKELLRAAREPFGEAAFEFRHILIQDAVYGAIPKDGRARLHERFAERIVSAFSERILEVEELVGYHFEQAHHYRAELAARDEHSHELARRAGGHLAAAGSRALARSDIPAALNLLERATRLLEPGSDGRADALLDLAAALRESGDLARADAVLSDAIDDAAAAGNTSAEARGRIERVYLRVSIDRAAVPELIETAELAIPVFEAHEDQRGLALALYRVAVAHWYRCESARMEKVLERAVVHAERAGDRDELSSILGLLARGAMVGPRHVDDATTRCRELRQRAQGNLKLEATIDCTLAVLAASRGSIEDARRLYRGGIAMLDELGLKLFSAATEIYVGLAELIGGDPAVAERELRRGYDVLEAAGERGWLSTIAGLLARALYEQGRYDDAESFTAVCERAALVEDIGSQVFWRQTRAKLLARRGDPSAGELAGRAVALAGRTDFVNVQADALADLAETMRLVGRPADAAAGLDAALRLYEAKGNLVSAGAARALLADPTAFAGVDHEATR